MTNPLISAEQLEIDRQAVEIERLRAALGQIARPGDFTLPAEIAREALAHESYGDEEPKVPGCHRYEP